MSLEIIHPLSSPSGRSRQQLRRETPRARAGGSDAEHPSLHLPAQGARGLSVWLYGQVVLAPHHPPGLPVGPRLVGLLHWVRGNCCSRQHLPFQWVPPAQRCSNKISFQLTASIHVKAGPQPTPAEAAVGLPSRALSNSSHTHPCPAGTHQEVFPREGSFVGKRRRRVGGRRTGHHRVY